MAHCRLLFVGGRANLQKIFDDTPDSSSESAAEMTIGADWVADYDFISEEQKKLGWTTDNFTKESNPELYQEIINGNWYDCYDVRDTKHYGSFDCINCSDFEHYDGIDWKEKEKRNKIRAIEVIKTLPVDTLFHFADSHW
jgi:hypothetical protein